MYHRKLKSVLCDDLAGWVEGGWRGKRYMCTYSWFTWSAETKKCKAIAAAAKSLQSRPTLCDPIDGSPPGSPVPGILQARTLEWVAVSFSNAWKWKVKTKSLSRVRLLATPWTAAHQAPVHGIFQARVLERGDIAFSRQSDYIPIKRDEWNSLSLEMVYILLCF